jgi:hypothetical protein
LGLKFRGPYFYFILLVYLYKGPSPQEMKKIYSPFVITPQPLEMPKMSE